MYGYLVYGCKRLRFFEEEVMGLTLLWAELPRRGRVEGWEERALDFFHRAGVRRLLNGGTGLEHFPLVETGELWRERAAEAALVTLKQEKIPLKQAVVGLRSSRWTKEMERTCMELSPIIRALSLEIPNREEIVWDLQRFCGIPVLQGAGDVTLCFTPAEPGDGRILLGGERPAPEGLTLWAEVEECPEGCPVPALAAALREHGIWVNIQVKTSEKGR